MQSCRWKPHLIENGFTHPQAVTNISIRSPWNLCSRLSRACCGGWVQSQCKPLKTSYTHLTSTSSYWNLRAQCLKIRARSECNGLTLHRFAVAGGFSRLFLLGASRLEVNGLDNFLKLLDERADVDKRERGLLTGMFYVISICALSQERINVMKGQG